MVFCKLRPQTKFLTGYTLQQVSISIDYMIRKRLLFFLTFWFLVAGSSQAQNFDDASKLSEVLSQMMQRANNTQGIRATDTLTMNWSSLPLSTRELALKVAQKMKEQKARPVPHYSAFAASLNAINNFSASQKEQFLKVAENVVTNNQPAAYPAFFDAITRFANQNTIYKSGAYTLNAATDRFSFGYIASDDADYSQSGWGNNDVNASIYYTATPPPMIEGAFISFDAPFTLMAQNANDTLSIKNTKGTYLLEKGLFVGKGGSFVKQTSNPAIKYEMTKYVWKVKEQSFAAENVMGQYAKTTASPVKGHFEYEMESGYNWPQFSSYKGGYNINTPYKSATVKGGVTIKGGTFSTKAINGDRSVLSLKMAERPFKAYSSDFVIGDTILKGNRAHIWAQLDEQDSLTHSSVAVTYNDADQLIYLDREKGSFEDAPFRDSYHQMEINAERAIWRADSNRIHFDILNGASQVPAFFESMDFYSQTRYNNIQSIYSFHPLKVVFNHYGHNKKEVFYLSDIEQDLDGRVTKKALHNAMKLISSHGYIEYDEVNEQIKVLPRLKQTGIASYGLRDYDMLSIASVDPPMHNGTIFLDNNELKIYGVAKVFLHDSLRIAIIPEERTLTVLRNRDIIFDGALTAGLFHAIGKDLRYDYQKNLVDMPQIDSLQMREYDRYGKPRPLGQLENRYKNTSGVIYVNDPANKSNTKNIKRYPILDVITDSYVYFDEPRYLGGVYDRRMFFESVPFTIDSSASQGTAALKFDGTFHTDGIFPKFRETLNIQGDRTLGFKHKVPATGYELFRGNGKFYGTLELNSEGLTGKGEIKFATSTVASDNFVFYQDSVVSKSFRHCYPRRQIRKSCFPRSPFG